jgi:carboxymethylenebutenolidase
MPVTDAFANFADEERFRMSHDLPLPYTHISEIGKDITFKAADGTDAYGYELKASKPSDKYILVFHEWWGLNDHIKREAEKIYKDLGDVNVIALDLYDKKSSHHTRGSGSIYAIGKDRKSGKYH